MQLPADAFNCLFQTSPSSHCHGFANPLSTYVVTMFWTIRFGCDSKWLTFILRWINGTNHQFCGFLAVHLWSSDQNILPHPSFLPGIATTAKTWTMGRHLWWFFDQQNTEGIGLNKTIQVIQNWICLQLTMCQPENVAAFVCFMPQTEKVNFANEMHPFSRNANAAVLEDAASIQAKPNCCRPRPQARGSITNSRSSIPINQTRCVQLKIIGSSSWTPRIGNWDCNQIGSL